MNKKTITILLYLFSMILILLSLFLFNKAVEDKNKQYEIYLNERIEWEEKYKVDKAKGQYLVKCTNGSYDVFTPKVYLGNYSIQIICGQIIM